LAFSTKSSKKSKTSRQDEDEDDAGMEDAEEDVAKKNKKTSDGDKAVMQENSSLKKRPLSAVSNVKVEATTAEEVVKEEDDSDDEPVLKRPKRNGLKAEENESTIPGKSTKVEKHFGKETGKTKAMPPPPRAVKHEEDEVDEAPTSSIAEKSRSRSASVAEASASEVEEDAEEDDEDEKPEVAAKAREKVQTTLKSKDKDPYPDWKPGEPVPYAALCTTFSLIEMTTKRLIIAAHCSLFLRQVLRLTPDDLLPTVLLMINKLAADYAGIELGIGESLIMKAIGETTGRSLQVIKQDQKEIGDLGLVAVKSRSKQPTMYKPKALTVRGVHKGLIDIATTTGHGAQGRKVDLIKKLLSAADGNMSGKVDITKDKGGASEAKFLVRFLEGKLRLGLAEKTVLVSLAQAMVCHEIESQGKGKIPSTEQMAQGEAILKTVYRYVFPGASFYNANKS
jgi:DNA ligase 1